MHFLRHCIGINREPPRNQNWYCHKCGNTKLDDSPENAQTEAKLSSNSNHSISPNSSSNGNNANRENIAAGITANENNSNGNIFSNNDNVVDSNDNNTSLNKSSTNADDSGSLNNSSFFNSGIFSSDEPSNYLNSIKKKKKK